MFLKKKDNDSVKQRIRVAKNTDFLTVRKKIRKKFKIENFEFSILIAQSLLKINEDEEENIEISILGEKSI